MIAVLAFWRDREHQALGKIRQSDEIYLSIARELFDEVYKLLENRSNDRVTWVRASRLLLQALKIKEKLSTKEVLDSYESVKQKLRDELYRVLSYDEKGKSSRQPLPPQFFYGIDDWDIEESLNNAAIKSSSRLIVSSVTIDKNIESSSSKSLAKKSVIAIYDFLEYPKDYIDLLDTVENWTGDWTTAHGHNQGAKRFVSHVTENSVFDGKLINIKDNDKNQKDR